MLRIQNNTAPARISDGKESLMRTFVVVRPSKTGDMRPHLFMRET